MVKIRSKKEQSHRNLARADLMNAVQWMLKLKDLKEKIEAGKAKPAEKAVYTRRKNEAWRWLRGSYKNARKYEPQ